MSTVSRKASYEVYDFISQQCNGRSPSIRIQEWYNNSDCSKIQAEDVSVAVNSLPLLPNNTAAQRAAAIINDCSRAIREPVLYHELSKGCLYMGLIGLAATFVDRKIGLSILSISIVAFTIIRANKSHNQNKAIELYRRAVINGYFFLRGKYTSWDKEYISDLPVYEDLAAFRRDLCSTG